MPQSSAQQRASDRVAAWLAHHEKNPAWLVDETKADPGTIGDFLNGSRWPKLGTQGRIERALGWRAGTIRQIGNGADPDELGATVGAEPQDESYVAAPGDRVEGEVSNAELMKAILEMKRDIEELKQGRGRP